MVESVQTVPFTQNDKTSSLILKALFIHDGHEIPLSVDEAAKIAKKMAFRMELGEKVLLKVQYIQHVPMLNGWVVVVSSPYRLRKSQGW